MEYEQVGFILQLNVKNCDLDVLCILSVVYNLDLCLYPKYTNLDFSIVIFEFPV